MSSILEYNLQFRGFNKHFHLTDALTSSGSRFVTIILTRRTYERLSWYDV